MREKYGAKKERSTGMRFHTQTAGVSLTEQQPEVNLIPVAIEALAAVLGGTQSLTRRHGRGDRAALSARPRLAVRTQQVILHEPASRRPSTRSRLVLRRGAHQRGRAWCLA